MIQIFVINLFISMCKWMYTRLSVLAYLIMSIILFHSLFLFSESSLSVSTVFREAVLLPINSYKYRSLLQRLTAVYKEESAGMWKSNRKAQLHLLNTVLEVIRQFLNTHQQMNPAERFVLRLSKRAIVGKRPRFC